jgi:hypothetical protein
MPNNTLRLIALLSILLSACAGIGPKTYSISEQVLQEKLAKHIARPITLMKMVNITLSNPVLKLDEQTNRISAVLDTSMRSPLIEKTLFGKMKITGKLEYAESEHAVMLAEPSIDSIDIDGVDSKHNAMVSNFAKALSSEILGGLPLYTLKPEELKTGNTEYLPQDFKIVGNQLKITLQPKK